MTETLEVRGLVKRYKSVVAVSGVNLHVARGEIVGLLGPNGAGKTTTFYMIVGMTRPDEGSIFLEGRDITKRPIHERAHAGLTYLPQEPSVFRGLTVYENVFGVLEANGVKRGAAEERTTAVLESLSLSRLANRKTSVLSGGERRRVEIARALAMEPKYVLLDEPFAGIDPIAIAELKQRILQLKALNLGIILSDHNVRETLEVCDRAYIVEKGSVLAEGTPRELVDDPKVLSAYLGDGFRLD